MKKRAFLKLSASAVLALSIGSVHAAETLKIGAVAPKTGGLAGGAVVSFWPNVKLWAHDVNTRGGLDVGGTKYMVEIIEYDDQTNPGETIKAVQRLAKAAGCNVIVVGRNDLREGGEQLAQALRRVHDPGGAVWHHGRAHPAAVLAVPNLRALLIAVL